MAVAREQFDFVRHIAHIEQEKEKKKKGPAKGEGVLFKILGGLTGLGWASQKF